jgi:hypothetical protein
MKLCKCPQTAAFVFALVLVSERVQEGSSFSTCSTSIRTTSSATLQRRTRSPNNSGNRLALRLDSKRNANDSLLPVEQDRTPFEEQFDSALEETSLSRAIKLLEDHPDTVGLTRERWSKVFAAIERRTTEAEENTENTRFLETSTTSQYPMQSPARNEMTKLYELLAKLSHLRLFGAAKDFPPAAGSQTVTPALLEQITDLNIVALTPKPTNTLLLAGAALALTEGFAALQLGWDLNFLTFATLALALLDRIATNGAVMESFVKLFNPGVQQKIVRHEAGHFLAAYLLGLPVEGCVLSAWAALRDARFDKRQVSAGTSFFDPVLSHEINKAVVTRSSVDRYSIVVMAGIAAEAIHFGRADGGAGDEMALVAFLSQLNGRPKPGVLPVWNNDSIRNQARWGALQAVLLLREYKVAYEALVDALERGGDLGDCIFAIEKAGRDNGLECLKRPLGFIIDDGQNGVWTTNITSDKNVVVSEEKQRDLSNEISLQTLQVYRDQMEERLKDIDQRLEEINGKSSLNPK